MERSIPRRSHVQQLVLLSLLVTLSSLVGAGGAQALDVAAGPKGINARATGLDGTGVKVGQFELARPSKAGHDTDKHDYLNVEGVGLGLAAAPRNQRTRLTGTEPPTLDHAWRVAGVLISSNTANAARKGIVPAAKLYSGSPKEIGGADLDALYDDVNQGMQWVVDQGVSVFNSSFQAPIAEGAKRDGSSQVAGFVDWATREKGVLFVQAGNEAGKPTHETPADAYNNIVVSFTTQSEGGGNYDKVSDLAKNNVVEGDRRKVDILAPGDKIDGLPTAPDNLLLGPFNGTGTDDSGTSYAAPLVAGIAAQLKQRAAGNALPPKLSKAIIMNSAEKIEGQLGMKKTIKDKAGNDWTDSEAYGSRTIPLDDQMGVGQAEATRAKTQYDAGQHDHDEDVPLIGWNTSTLAEGNFHDYKIEKPLKEDSYLSAMLVWDRTVTLDESSGTANDKFDHDDEEFQMAAAKLANFDLFLMEADDEDHSTSIWSSQSDVDNVEHIFRQIATGGKYKLRVVLTDLPGGADASYALAWWSVPEPASWLSMALALAAMAFYKRRQGRRANELG